MRFEIWGESKIFHVVIFVHFFKAMYFYHLTPKHFIMNTSKSILKEKSLQFAISIVNLHKDLCSRNREFVMSKQLLRAGTSIGANIREAKNAESTKDFIHKLGIAQKECDETLFWLELLNKTAYISNLHYIQISDDANQIYKMLKSTILTIKQKEKNA